MTTYDAAIIGGGFKGMMTAYGLAKQGLRVCIIEKSEQLGGFMAPMNWHGTAIDKGPQYLDGVSETHKLIIDDIMSDSESLDSLDYSYGTFWNGKYTEGFALPDYRTLPKADKSAVLYETISYGNNPTEASNIAELYDDSTTRCYSYIKRWCNKFLQQDAQELSPLNRNIVTFFGRKLLLDNDLSLKLKQHPFLDDVLAANKKGIDHHTHNLYPKGKNLGYFRQAFENKLASMGVSIFSSREVKNIRDNAQGKKILLSDASVLTTQSIYCTATIEVTENILLQSTTIDRFISPVAQIFYLLELDFDEALPFYIMNYSDCSLSRVTNFTAYANRSTNGKAILCAEVPTKIGSDIWQDPVSHHTTLCAEIAEMGIDTSKIEHIQGFKVPSTYRAVMAGYEAQLEMIMDRIIERHGENIHIPTPHLLTRASIMADLSSLGILN